jgi:phosphoglycolate phosphatase
MPFHAVLFDLDGTLLNTLQDIADSVNTVLAGSGFPTHNPDAYRYFVGDGSEELARRVLPEGKRDGTTITKVVRAIDIEYAKHWAKNTLPYQGVPELLDGIAKVGLKMCILSNKPQQFTEMTVARFLPKWQFDIVVGAQPGVPKKHDPTTAIQIARTLDIPTGEFLYLGDTATDMKTAVAAGMYPVGALWGFRTADELETAGAKVLAETPSDILRLLQPNLHA